MTHLKHFVCGSYAEYTKELTSSIKGVYFDNVIMEGIGLNWIRPCRAIQEMFVN